MNSVREALANLAERSELRDYDAEILRPKGYGKGAVDGWNSFCEKFSAVHGKAMDRMEDLTDLLKEDGHDFGYCDPALKSSVGEVLEKAGLEVSYEFHRDDVNDHAFGITRASGVIAESGSVILKDEDTVDRLAALAPWVHVAVLSDEPIYETISEAIDDLGDSPNVIWVTGPSKTADIEGILIEGVHGPGVQICLKI